MGDWKRVCRCKECGKIYPNEIPLICRKCGTEIGVTAPTILRMLGHGEVTLTKKCEKVIAKKGIFGWKVKKKEWMKMKICPRCGRCFERLPAVSRTDNKTMICDECGTKEANKMYYKEMEE